MFFNKIIHSSLVPAAQLLLCLFLNNTPIINIYNAVPVFPKGTKICLWILLSKKLAFFFVYFQTYHNLLWFWQYLRWLYIKGFRTSVNPRIFNWILLYKHNILPNIYMLSNVEIWNFIYTYSCEDWYFHQWSWNWARVKCISAFPTAHTGWAIKIADSSNLEKSTYVYACVPYTCLFKRT